MGKGAAVEGTVAGWFEPDAASGSHARALLRDVRELLAGDTLERLEVVIGELASNAVQHAGTQYQVRVDASLVRVEVTDGTQAPPVLRRPSLIDEGGRGLVIVDAYSDSWGYQLLPQGKVVWAQLWRG